MPFSIEECFHHRPLSIRDNPHRKKVQIEKKRPSPPKVSLNRFVFSSLHQTGSLLDGLSALAQSPSLHWALCLGQASLTFDRTCPSNVPPVSLSIPILSGLTSRLRAFFLLPFSSSPYHLSLGPFNYTRGIHTISAGSLSHHRSLPLSTPINDGREHSSFDPLLPAVGSPARCW